ncbi:MAG: DUF167 domain-containing protein [Labedaea sp.]
MSGAFRFAVRVRAGASRTAVGGRHGEALVVAVAAPAVEGKANEAVRRALAEAFGVRRGQVFVVRGDRARDKVVEIDIEPDRGAVLLAALFG